MKKHRISRRTFIKGSAAAGLAVGAAGCRTAGDWRVRKPRSIAPDEKLNIACIGVGGKGRSDIVGVSSENIVALCDVERKPPKVDDARLKELAGIPWYQDYRQMLKEMDDQIDAVMVSTPDHTHYPAAKMAIEMGKHVFVQKPLTHTVWEADDLLRLSRKHEVATIMGNQGRAGHGVRLMREWVQAGVIGPVHEVHIWTNRPIWPQGMDRPQEAQPVPDSLDWNLWLGVAPERPYNEAYCPFKWRGWWDFGCGALGDMGCHIMDASFYALDLGDPICVEAVSSPVNNESAPEWSIVTYQFPERNGMPAVTVKWFDGVKKAPRPKDLEADRELGKGGQIILGEKGTIMDTSDYCWSPRLIPESKMQDFMPKRPPETIPRVPDGNHYQEWIRACKGGKPAGSNFEYSVPLTKMVVLGNVAIRSGKRIQWDGEAIEVTNSASANQYVTKTYRKF